jgi:hypothetical protein
MAKSDKFLGYILTDGKVVWCGNKGGGWQRLGKRPFKTYSDLAAAKAAIARLTLKRWDMTGVTAEPIRCP